MVKEMIFIKLLKYIFLGFIQGITEPIPVSSSGHLLIIENLIKGLDTIDYKILATITNFGSLCAILLIYRKQIIELITDFFKYRKSKKLKYYTNYKYSWYIFIATLPAGIIGLIITKLGIFNILENNIKFVGLTLLITALFLYIIKDFKGSKTKKEISLKDSLIIGIFQVFALVPGISRSGATIVGGTFRNLKRETAFDFSFLLYIPISIATTILGIKDLIDANLQFIEIIYYIISMFISFIFTLIATKWFKNIVKNGNLIYFVIYCLIIGSIVIIFL